MSNQKIILHHQSWQSGNYHPLALSAKGICLDLNISPLSVSLSLVTHHLNDRSHDWSVWICLISAIRVLFLRSRPTI